MRRVVSIVAIVVVLAGAGAARAQIEGNIYGPGTKAFAMAVVPLRNLAGQGDAGSQFAKVLARDLELSGYFRLLDPATFIENASSGLTAAETDFIGWTTLGAQGVVKGSVSVTGGSATVEARLFDVPGRSEVLGRRYSGPRNDLPRMAHRFADAILEFLTGEKGPFDSQVVLVSNRSGRLKDVYLWTFDRDEPVRLTDERSLVVGPRWRPDGRAVLFTSYREHVPRLFEFDLVTRSVRRLVGGADPVLGGAWSPDGSRLVVTREEGGNTDLFLVDRSGRTLDRLTDHWAIDVSPSWSPDGSRIAFCSARSGTPQIYVMNADGSGVTRISQGNYNTSPAWSPKGDRIAYTTRAGGFQIVVASASGGGSRTIGAGEDPTWGSDGRYLIFSGARGGRRHLMLADRDGRTLKELTRGAGDDTSPSWRPGSE